MEVALVDRRPMRVELEAGVVAACTNTDVKANPGEHADVVNDIGHQRGFAELARRRGLVFADPTLAPTFLDVGRNIVPAITAFELHAPRAERIADRGKGRDIGIKRRAR